MIRNGILESSRSKATYPTDGLVARYTFEDAIADQYSTNDLTVTAGQTAAYSTTCKVGTKSFAYNGLMALQVPSSLYYLAEGTHVFTISAWLYFGNAANSDCYNFYITQNSRTLSIGGAFHRLYSGTNAYCYLTTTLQKNQWYHFVWLFDGTYMKQWLNGTQEGGNVSAGSAPGVSWWGFGYMTAMWGIYGFSPSGNFIDALYIYDKAISESDIATLYNAGAGV